MKATLEFIGWQPPMTPDGKRGLALFNGPDGSTITLRTALERFEEFRIAAHTVVLDCPEHGFCFVSETEDGAGWEFTGDAGKAWLFNPDRGYEYAVAERILRKVPAFGVCSGARAFILSLEDVVALAKKRNVKGLEVGNFFLHESETDDSANR